MGRSAYNKAYDDDLKLSILRQQTGLQKIPLSVDYTNMAMFTQKWADFNTKDPRKGWRLKVKAG